MKKNNVYILEERGLLYISGEDCKEFLQNIITNNINKIDEKIKDIDKNLQLKNLVKLKIMSSDNLLEAYNIPFYEPKIIYEDQINIEDNRIIYTKDLVEYKQSDPIFIQKQQLNNVLQRRQNLINELKVLQNG